MVRCIDCDHLYIREGDHTTYFCLLKRDYLDDVDEERACGDFYPLVG